MPNHTDAVASGKSSEMAARRGRRGPRPSPSKQKRDAERVDSHRTSCSGPQLCGPDLQQEHIDEKALSARSSEPLASVAEVGVIDHGAVDPTKVVQKERLRRQREEEEAAGAIDFSTSTVHAPGDALKAESLDLDVGTTCLLRDSKLVISEQISQEPATYGLVGPNGCGKTTLMRLIAERRLPTPSSWGEPFLVDQLDPEPTGRSPIEEVLSGCRERAALLNEEQRLVELLSASSDADEEVVEKLSLQLSEIYEQLARWDGAEKEVTRILVGLGFHDGDEGESSDGAPSLRVKDELVESPSDLKINGFAEVRDGPDEQWLRGIVTSLEPVMVQPSGFTESFRWTEVRHTRELSGGWRKKVNLAKALWLKPKLLLLDEPTNHLDYHAQLWLAKELEEYPHTMVVVSHNACFLRDVCSKVLQIVDKHIKTIPMADLSEEKLAAMQRSDEQHHKFRDWSFAYPSGDRPELHGLSFHDVSFSYSPEGKTILRDVHRDVVRFHGRSRTVILGRNGSGKSTLLKLCLGSENGGVEPTHGEVDRSCELRHFSQHFNEALERYPDHAAANYLVECCRTGLKKRFHHTDEERLHEDACEVLSWFGLDRRTAAKTAIKDLSGGQKARLNFAFLNLCPAHLLILDEPTNHLDANGLEHLTDALKSFGGGVVLVSHDELLVRRVLRSSEYSELLICDDGRIRRESGGLRGLDSYRRAAFREQYIRAEAAAKKAEETLQRSREERRRPRGRKGVSASAASTREPTPEVQSSAQAQAAVPVPTGSKPSLDKLFGKRKPKSMNLNAKPK